jgi:hypothetical protein
MYQGARPAARAARAGRAAWAPVPARARSGSTVRSERPSVRILVGAISIGGCLEPVPGGLLSVRAGLPSVLCRASKQVRSLISSHAWTVRASLIKAGDALMRLRHALVHPSESVLSPAR